MGVESKEQLLESLDNSREENLNCALTIDKFSC